MNSSSAVPRIVPPLSLSRFFNGCASRRYGTTRVTSKHVALAREGGGGHPSYPAQGVGKVYIQTVLDCFSLYVWARLYTSKRPVTAVQILNSHVLPLFEEHGVKIQTVLSDNGREYCGREDRHPYQAVAKARCGPRNMTSAKCRRTVAPTRPGRRRSDIRASTGPGWPKTRDFGRKRAEKATRRPPV